MPKIPSYTAQLRPTTDINIPKSGVQMPITAPFTGLQSTIADYYVKEKTAEANTNATKTISDLYNDQEDGTQGLFTIKSELSANPNPSQVTKDYDNKVNTLWSSVQQSSKYSEMDNFTKSAVKEKFFATAGVLKTDVLKGSRDSLFKEESKVVDGYYQNETIMLKELGAKYLPFYEKNISNTINNLTALDAGQKKILLDEKLNFGKLELAQSMLNRKESESLTEMLKNGTIKLDAKSFNQVFDQAQKQNTSNIFSELTSGISQTPGINNTQLGTEYNKVLNFSKGIFETERQKELYNKLSPTEKGDLIKNANEKYNIVTTQIKIQNDDINRAVSDATQKSMKNVVNSSKINEYNPNVINNSFGSDEKIKKDFFKLNEVIKNNEDIKATPYQYKFDILKKIANGDIININTPVRTGMDAQGTTLVEKVINKEISKKDLEMFNSLMQVNGVDQKTKDNMKQFFNFIQANETLVGGVSTFRNFDPTYDSRMNSFIDDMYTRYTDGLKKGLQPKDMLSRNSENFIAKDGAKYTLNRDDVNIQLEETIKKQSQKQYKVGDVVTNSKGEKATVLRIEQNGKVILQKQ
jgi:hypothetical protein